MLHRLFIIGLCLPSILTGQVGAEEEEEKRWNKKSVYIGNAVGVANTCLELGLSREEALATSAINKNLQRKPGEPRIVVTPEATRKRNAIIRDALREILGPRRIKQHNEAVVQFFFSILRPDLAFEWLEIELTPKQRELLDDIKLSDKTQDQLVKDRIQVVVESLIDVAPLSQIQKAVGKPYAFQKGTLKQEMLDLTTVPDLEPIRVLDSLHVRAHLKLSPKQVKKVSDLVADYRAQKLLPKDDFADFIALTAAQMEEVRLAGIADAEKILNETQRVRFREIVAQRYLFSMIPDYGLRYLGIKAEGRAMERFHERRNALASDLETVRCMRVNEEMRVHVGKIVGQDLVDNIMGKPVTFMPMRQKPKLDNSVVKELLRRASRNTTSKNPRRER